jgi:arylsulfatase A-like enzyme
MPYFLKIDFQISLLCPDAAFSMVATAETETKPNIIIILADDLGPGDLSCAGATLFDGYYDRSVEDLNSHQPTGGLRGWKYLMFEGGYRVPFIARWPQQIKPRVSDQLISLLDCYHTLAKIVGYTTSAEAAPDSLDLSAVLLGRTQEHIRPHTVLHDISGFALRQVDWKYIPATTNTDGIGSGALATDPHFAAATTPEPLLFNLATDPNETTNVLPQNPDKAIKLDTQLETVKRTSMKQR